VNDSRVFAGVHFRHAVTEGAKLGKRVGEYVYKNYDGGWARLTRLACSADQLRGVCTHHAAVRFVALGLPAWGGTGHAQRLRQA
jgi:hypothetical protein